LATKEVSEEVGAGRLQRHDLDRQGQPGRAIAFAQEEPRRLAVWALLLLVRSGNTPPLSRDG
jgi:hypothetical protein